MGRIYCNKAVGGVSAQMTPRPRRCSRRRGLVPLRRFIAHFHGNGLRSRSSAWCLTAELLSWKWKNQRRSSHGLASPDFYGDWSTARLIFPLFSSPRALIACMYTHTNTHTRTKSPSTHFPAALALLDSQVSRGPLGPLRRPNKDNNWLQFIVGCVEPHPTFDLLFGGRRPLPRPALPSSVSSPAPPSHP